MPDAIDCGGCQRGAQRVSYVIEPSRSRVEPTMREQNALLLQNINQWTRDQYCLRKVSAPLAIAAIS
jgi:hypothetical protein